MILTRSPNTKKQGQLSNGTTLVFSADFEVFNKLLKMSLEHNKLKIQIEKQTALQ